MPWHTGIEDERSLSRRGLSKKGLGKTKKNKHKNLIWLEWRRTMTTQDWIAMKQKQKQYLEARRVSDAMVSLLAPKCVLLMLEFHGHSTFVVKENLNF